MDEHLGYDKHDRPGVMRQLAKRHSDQVGADRDRPVQIEVPRNRDGAFEPQIVRKWRRWLNGIDQLVLSLTARGLATVDAAICS